MTSSELRTIERSLEAALTQIVEQRERFLAGLSFGVPKTPEERRQWTLLCFRRHRTELELECLSLRVEARVLNERRMGVFHAVSEARLLDVQASSRWELLATREAELREATAALHAAEVMARG